MLDQLVIPIERAVMVPVVIPPNPTQGAQLPLPVNGLIQNPNMEVVAVEAVSSAVMAFGPNGESAYGANVNMTLNLFSGANQITQDLPLGLIDPSKNGGTLRYFEPFFINMQASYVTLTGPSAGYVAGRVIYLIFYIRNRFRA